MIDITTKTEEDARRLLEGIPLRSPGTTDDFLKDMRRRYEIASINAEEESLGHHLRGNSGVKGGLRSRISTKRRKRFTVKRFQKK
jgi:hypothetical protein